MTDERILAAVIKYENVFYDYGDPLRADPKAFVDEEARFRHLHFMCGEIRTFLQLGKREKAMRRLGFIQGVLWGEGIATIDELKADNQSDPEA